MALAPDQKFSTFNDGGDLTVGDIVVGLRGGLNTRFLYTGALPPGVIVPISQGGTGADNAADARTNLGLGTIATQNASAVAITGGTISGVAFSSGTISGTTITSSTAVLTSGSVAAAPVAGIDLANKTYVDSKIAGSPTSIVGTQFQVLANGNFGTNEVGTVTLTTPQDIAAASSPTFAGMTLTAALNMSSQFINNVLNPVNPQDAATKDYVDNNYGQVDSVVGTTNQIDVDNTDPQNPVVSLSSTLILPGTMKAGGDVDMDSNQINNMADPTNAQDAATKAYVDGTVSSAGAAGTIARSDGSTYQPSTATFADTYAASTLLYSNGANTVQGLATANSAMLVTSATGVPVMSGSMADGELIIGVTGGTPIVGEITAGPGISVAKSAGGIQVSGTGSGIGWNEVTGATQTIVADNGYVANNAGGVVFTLPTTAAFGTVINIVGKGAGGWQVDQNAGQNIQIGNVSSTVGAGGSIASTNAFDSISLVCTTADTVFSVLGGPQGNITIV